MSNLFDFTDTADLSADLQGRLAGGGRVNPNIAKVAELITAGKAAGQPTLSISMIEAVWFRMGNKTISQQTLRNALNGAVAGGLIMKPTRQTYAVMGHVDQVVDEPPVEGADEAPSDPPVDVTDDTTAEAVDPLA